MKVSDVGEIGLIKIISDILGGLGSNLLSGEDDAVAIPFAELSASNLVINNDMLVSTTDVPSQMTLYEAGRKAVVMTVSDIFVKGARPKWGIVSLGFPKDLEVEGLHGFKAMIMGIEDSFNNYGIKYLGGDLNESKEVIISCTVIGTSMVGKKIIPRSGAKPGDIIISTDQFGKTGCGFQILLNKRESEAITKEQRENFVTSVLRPETDDKTAAILVENNWVNASADSSDGIQKTITEICRASNVGAEIYMDQLPIADGVIEFAENLNLDINDLIFRAGEEFLHIFTVPGKSIELIEEKFNLLNKSIYKIGQITEQANVLTLIEKGGNKIPLQINKTGYNHFSKTTETEKLKNSINSTRLPLKPILLKKSPKENHSFDAHEVINTRDSQIDTKDLETSSSSLITSIGHPNDDMPGYRQYPGACGLTSLLMALKPKKRGISDFLRNTWHIIKPIFGQNSERSDGYNWQRTLEFLLFQIYFDKQIRKIARNGFGENFNDVIIPVLESRIFEVIRLKKPNSSNLELNARWIMRRVNVWKMDFELELLANLFGCTFIPWEKTDDGTGAVFFTKDDLINKDLEFFEKIDFLTKYLDKGNPVLCCASIHWIAVKEIKQISGINNEFLVRYNDPATGEEHRRNLQGFGNSERFYAFEFHESDLKTNLRKLQFLLSEKNYTDDEE